MRICIISITRNGSKMGARLSGLIVADHFFPERYKDAIKEGTPFSSGMKDLLKEIFYRYEGLIFIMAAGIVVRVIAPLIKDKGSDPAVVVVDEKGKFAISLLSGHLGGANELAMKIGSLTDARPVITTATDLNGFPSIDMMARELDLVIEDISRIKIINSAILDGVRIGVYCRDEKLINYFRKYSDHFDIYNNYECIKVDIPCVVIDNNTAINGRSLPHNALILRPKNIVVGMGCNRGTKKEEFKDLYLATLRENNLSDRSVRNIATMDIKRDEDGLIRFAEELGLEIEYYSKDDLLNVALPSGVSMNALINVGVGGVCEPAALLSAKTERLLVKKIKRGNVTIAIAEAVSL